MQSPTKLLPGGFLLVFFGILGLVFTGLAGYAAWLAFHKEVIEKQVIPYHYGYLLGAGIFGLITSVFLIYFGIKLSWEVPNYKL